MSESDKAIAKAVAQEVLQYMQDAHGTICPLGMTAGDVLQIQAARRFFWWFGLIFAGTLIAAFASGVGYVFVAGFKKMLHN